ncbi:asparaginase [Collinsella sp. zg1085]|uniref:asparaginase n=1 Tax=Collinsella sp. zg1085 TaxID=2844380 RepID=UPI001C0C69D0|nr:asparaginase [Collinsella sp. zg1085]QWT17495.1 asparaginase [Collinsella sp. zg1085]
MKKILVIATGGTIASREGGQGLSPALSGEELLAFVPELSGLCQLDVVQPMNIDSTNMRPDDWLRIQRVIFEGYYSHDGFVVLHGTDTMAYSAAALSYLIQQSAKPIVFTGSQQPMGNPFTDAKLNLYQSVLYALHEGAHDVHVVFGGMVIAGTRAHKQRTMSYNAFRSINFPPRAYIRNDRVVMPGYIDTQSASDISVSWYSKLNDRVCVLKLTPGFNPQVFELLKRDYDGIILETFGMGGVPLVQLAQGPSFEEAIFDWVDSGRTLVLTTQVPEEGMDLGVYEVGRSYSEHAGILQGGDMTTEALVAKTMWILGATRDPKKIAELFYRPVNFDRES